MPLLHHGHIHDAVNVLNLWHLHRLLDLLDRRHVPLLHHRHIHNSIDVLDLWHFDGPLDFLDRRHMPLLDNRHIHDAVDVLNLWHLDRNMDDLLHRDNFLYHFGDLGDVLLNDGLLALDGLLDDFRFLHFDSLDLILNNSVGDNLLHLRHLDNPLLDLNFRHLDDLLDDLWPRHLNDLLHRPLNYF